MMTQETHTVLLSDWDGGRKQYLLDPLTGSVDVLTSPSHQESSQSAAGFGAFRTVGLLQGRQKIFTALYTDQKTMLMASNGQVFDWSDAALRATRDSVAPFVKQFTISRSKERLVSLSYFYTDLLGTFPDDPGGDFFTYLAHETHSRSQIQRFVYFWTAKLRGRDVKSQEFVDELEQYVRSGER